MDEIPNKTVKHIKILTVLAIAASLSLGVYIYQGKDVTISIDDNKREVRTYEKTVDGLLKSEDIQLDEKAYINFALDEELKDDMKIVIKTPKPYTIYMGNVKAKINSPYTRVSDILKDLEIKLTKKDVVSPKLDEELNPNDKIKIARIEEVFEDVEENIPFKEEVKNNKNLDNGTTKVVQEGKEGVKKLKIKKKFEDGKLTKEEKVSETVAKEPVPKVIEKGTKVKEKVKVKRRNENKDILVSSNRGGKPNSRRSFVATATAYDLSYESCGKRPGDRGYGITASGMKARPGIIAVDPRVIPLGTKLYIESMDSTKDYGYAIAGDTGGAIKGNRVDLFFTTKAAARNFGRRKVKVHILD